MKIETKFNIGDKVFARYFSSLTPYNNKNNGKIMEFIVDGFLINSEVLYFLQNKEHPSYIINEDLVFKEKP